MMNAGQEEWMHWWWWDSAILRMKSAQCSRHMVAIDGAVRGLGSWNQYSLTEL